MAPFSPCARVRSLQLQAVRASEVITLSQWAQAPNVCFQVPHFWWTFEPEASDAWMLGLSGSSLWASSGPPRPRHLRPTLGTWVGHHLLGSTAYTLCFGILGYYFGHLGGPDRHYEPLRAPEVQNSEPWRGSRRTHQHSAQTSLRRISRFLQSSK